MLAFVQPSEAEIVYTPAHLAIKANGGLFSFDLDHNGVSDFGISNKGSVTSASYRMLRVRESRSANEIWMTNSKACEKTGSVAAALPKGRRTGPKGNFKHHWPYDVMMAYAGEPTTCGVWAGHSNLQAYLGLEFTIKGKIHFGWARVKVDTLQKPFSVTLTGYAYETIPGKAIIAGATKGPDDGEPTASFTMPTSEPATLGALAMGSPGLSVWRRKERAESTQ
jgi:hypothetical protein